MQTRFSIFAYCLSKIPIFRKSRPFCSARPCSAATSLKFPPHRVIGGNLRCCCSAGAAPQGFACGELDYLRSCLGCSFLFSFPPASSFSSSLSFFTGLPRLPTFPLPSRLFCLFPELPDFGALQKDIELPRCSSRTHPPLQPEILIQTL